VPLRALTSIKNYVSAHWHAHPGEYRSSRTWGTARAALRERFPGSTTLAAGCGGPLYIAAQQSFSGVGKNAHYRAEVQGALAHQDVRLQEVWAPQRDAG
jgi:hypothetical protein